MWSRLLAIKNHREHRLRAEINRIHAQIRAQTGALEDIRRQRVESAQRWRKHSQKTCTGKADQLHQLRSELNHFYTADLQLKNGRVRCAVDVTELLFRYRFSGYVCTSAARSRPFAGGCLQARPSARVSAHGYG